MGFWFYLVLAFQIVQILPHIFSDVSYFAELLARYTACLARVGLYEASVDRQVISLHEAGRDTLRDDLLEELLDDFRLLTS